MAGDLSSRSSDIRNGGMCLLFIVVVIDCYSGEGDGRGGEECR